MCNVNGSDRVLHSHSYLPWEITPSTVSNKPKVMSVAKFQSGGQVESYDYGHIHCGLEASVIPNQIYYGSLFHVESLHSTSVSTPLVDASLLM